MSMWICPNHGHTNTICCDSAQRVSGYDDMEWRDWPEFCSNCGIGSVEILTSVKTPAHCGNCNDLMHCTSCGVTGKLVVQSDDQLHIEWRDL